MSNHHRKINVAEAYALRAEGMTYANIGKRFNASAPAVYFALHPEKRSEPQPRDATRAEVKLES